MTIELLVIDPQVDFVDPAGALSVPGADSDMNRLARFVHRHSEQLDAIHITLDTHQRMDISHPMWWLDEQGVPPEPFTSFTAAQVKEGKWRTRHPEAAARSLAYLEALEAGGRYPHLVWPEHCLLGGPGHAIWSPLREAVHAWEGQGRRSELLLKGRNPWTEHFSAVRAEVVDPDDPHTQLRQGWVQQRAEASELLVSGEALSHCVANTVRDLVDAWGTDARRVTLLTDTCSSVGGFEAVGERFIEDLTSRGMKLATTETWHP